MFTNSLFEMMDDDFLNSDYSFYSALLQPIIIFFVVNVKFVTFYCFLSELLLLGKTNLCNCSLVHFLFRYCAVFHFEVVFAHYK